MQQQIGGTNVANAANEVPTPWMTNHRWDGRATPPVYLLVFVVTMTVGVGPVVWFATRVC